MFIIHKSSFGLAHPKTHPNAIDTGKSLIGNDFTDTNHFGGLLRGSV